MKKVKSILFRLNMNGNGVVNHDSNEQKFVFNGTNLYSKLGSKHDNVSYAKKKFYKNGDNLDYRLSISSDCLRHNLFAMETQIQSANIIHNESLLYGFIASPTQLMRGYLFAKDETLKRSGALSISDAEQTCGATTHLETFSRSGAKNSDKTNETADNSFYKKEVVGDIKYSAVGFIDLMKLQFISADQVFDRYAFNPDLFDFYKSLMKLKLPNFNSELGYYQQLGSDVLIPEYGYVLSNENINFIVKDMFLKLLTLKITKKNAFANVSKLQYKLVYDPLIDNMYNEDGWVSVVSKEDINQIDFETEFFYVLEDKEKSESLRKSLIETYEVTKLAKKAKKDRKKDDKNSEELN